jgi:hypothetical protein
MKWNTLFFCCLTTDNKTIYSIKGRKLLFKKMITVKISKPKTISLIKHFATLFALLSVLNGLAYQKDILDFTGRGRDNEIPLQSGRRYNQITFTNIGWFHPDPSVAKTTQRSLAAKYFMEAVLTHERFNASLWTTSDSVQHNHEPILAFLDFDACGLLHWPYFGGDYSINNDLDHGRHAGSSLGEVCSMIDKALESPSLQHHEDSRLVVISCNEWQPHGNVTDHCLSHSRNETLYKKLVVGHLDARYDTVHSNDFGLPPWPVKQVHMSEEQITNLRNCKERQIELSFKGRYRNNFPEFSEYFSEIKEEFESHNKTNNGQYLIEFGVTHYEESPWDNAWNGKVIRPTPKENQTAEMYYSWIMNSTFCPTPRGDDLYSVRFSEVMSAGCIPIVYANGWVLPYNSEIVKDWHSMVVLIPQSEVNTTKQVIDSISKEDRCRMQNNVYDFFQKYVQDSAGRLRAILELMDARLNHGPVNVSHAPE